MYDVEALYFLICFSRCSIESPSQQIIHFVLSEIYDGGEHVHRASPQTSAYSVHQVA
jgi:hypothetical protein